MTYIPQAKCPRCGEPGFITDYRPPRAIHPDLRQYECTYCEELFYKHLTRTQKERLQLKSA